MTTKNLLFGIVTLTLSIVFLLIQPSPTLSLESSSPAFREMNTTFAALNYEVKEKTSLENPVIDPNFNVMRKKDMNKISATILVVGILIIATVVPIVTWLYFSR